MAELTFGTTVVRCARPEPEYIEITTYGESRPTFIEKWRGWTVEWWCDWTWDEGGSR